jgi:hypothetical protein
MNDVDCNIALPYFGGVSAAESFNLPSRIDHKKRNEKGKAIRYVVLCFIDIIATWPTKNSLDLEGTESENRLKSLITHSLQGVRMLRNCIFTRELSHLLLAPLTTSQT